MDQATLRPKRPVCSYEKRHQKRLDSTIARSFADPEEQLEAGVEDRQGLGVPRRQ